MSAAAQDLYKGAPLWKDGAKTKKPPTYTQHQHTQVVIPPSQTPPQPQIAQVNTTSPTTLHLQQAPPQQQTQVFTQSQSMGQPQGASGSISSFNTIMQPQQHVVQPMVHSAAALGLVQAAPAPAATGLAPMAQGLAPMMPLQNMSSAHSMQDLSASLGGLNSSSTSQGSNQMAPIGPTIINQQLQQQQSPGQQSLYQATTTTTAGVQPTAGNFQQFVAPQQLQTGAPMMVGIGGGVAPTTTITAGMFVGGGSSPSISPTHSSTSSQRGGASYSLMSAADMMVHQQPQQPGGQQYAMMAMAPQQQQLQLVPMMAGQQPPMQQQQQQQLVGGGGPPMQQMIMTDSHGAQTIVSSQGMQQLYSTPTTGFITK